jgi:hypothetical protein
MDWHVASSLDGRRSIQHLFVCDRCDLVDVFTMPGGVRSASLRATKP